MAINSKSTKAVILDAYKEMVQQNKALTKKIEDSIKATQENSKNSASSKTIPSVRTLAEDNLTIDRTISSLTQTQNNFGGVISNLSQRLTVEATALANVRSSIADKHQELERLYQITEIDESTVDRLLEEYRESARELAAKFARQQASDRQEIMVLEQGWNKQRQASDRFICQRNEDYRKTQQREQEEYQYNLDLQRDLAESDYDREKKLRQQQLKEIRQDREALWQQKEAEIARQEQEYSSAAAKVAAFETQLAANVKQGTESGKSIGTYQAKVKTDLRAKEIEGETQNYRLKIAALEQTIEHQAGRIERLSQQLESSLQQVQDLAVKAIEGTSNRNSFEAVKAIALEQVKTTSKGK